MSTTNTCKRKGCFNSARKEYCSPACRKAAWRENHISLGDLDVSCPSCLKPIHHLLVLPQNGVLHAAEGQERPVTSKVGRGGV